MKYTSRPYRSENDLYEIGRLLRRAYAKRKYSNAWSFCRYDISSRRRTAEPYLFTTICGRRTLGSRTMKPGPFLAQPSRSITSTGGMILNPPPSSSIRNPGEA